MARALLGYVASNDQLREVENARLRARVRELQDQVDLLTGEVRALRAESEARQVVDSHLSEAQLDRLRLDEMAASSV